MKKYLTWGLLIILVTLTGWFFLNQRSDSTEAELFPGATWVEVGSTIGQNPLGSGELVGKSWEGTIDNLTEEELLALNIKEYYDEVFTNEGWADTIEYNGFTIEPIAADGPYGSLWGYLKQEGEGIRMVVVSSETSGEKLSGENEPILYGPPFEVGLGLFISEPFLNE